jgi:hypothetical protein
MKCYIGPRILWNLFLFCCYISQFSVGNFYVLCVQAVTYVFSFTKLLDFIYKLYINGHISCQCVNSVYESMDFSVNGVIVANEVTK